MLWNLLHVDIQPHTKTRKQNSLLQIIGKIPPKGSPFKAVCKMQTCRCRSSRQRTPPPLRSPPGAPPAAPPSPPTPPPLLSSTGPTTSYHSRIMKKEREKKNHEVHWLTHLFAIRSRLKSADATAVREERRGKNPNGAQRELLKILRWLRVRKCPLPPGWCIDGPVDLGQISAGGPHLAASRLFSAGYILGLVKAPAIKHTLLPSRAQFLPPTLSPSAPTRVHKLLGSCTHSHFIQ